MVDILAGLRVVEVGQVLAGPYAGAIFADLGAEVVKVERVEGGDDARSMGQAFRHGDALTFHIYNRGKKSVALDLNSAEGREAFDGLVATADIMLHNLRPGVPAKLGIDGTTLCARYPRLIYCEISAFGHVGPMAMRPGFEPLIQAYSGLCAINGGPDDPPMRAGPSVCDQGTGMWLVIGALAMLQRRARTGVGGIVNASLLETALMWCGQKVDALVNTGSMPPRHRMGHPGLVPYEAFEASDGPFMICAGNDRLFAKLADVMERPDWDQRPSLCRQSCTAGEQGCAGRGDGADPADADAAALDRGVAGRGSARDADPQHPGGIGSAAGAGTGDGGAGAG